MNNLEHDTLTVLLLDYDMITLKLGKSMLRYNGHLMLKASNTPH